MFSGMRPRFTRKIIQRWRLATIATRHSRMASPMALSGTSWTVSVAIDALTTSVRWPMTDGPLFRRWHARFQLPIQQLLWSHPGADMLQISRRSGVDQRMAEEQTQPVGVHQADASRSQGLRHWSQQLSDCRCRSAHPRVGTETGAKYWTWRVLAFVGARRISHSSFSFRVSFDEGGLSQRSYWQFDIFSGTNRASFKQSRSLKLANHWFTISVWRHRTPSVKVFSKFKFQLCT